VAAVVTLLELGYLQRCKNKNQSLKIKDGQKVPKKGEYWLGCNIQGQKNTWT
jgi:hypothetical protein